ncbi:MULTISPECIES: CPBP family intramembrane glutamic endopeptidase [unclassified Cryobacterium]|uniref:CPBP family intramembrane glutamic endopeptidase n=1 Tax=unclassified Cryobacterium TaxID=2649013 RepID=UPI00141B6F76|nr:MULTISPECIES: CPBP family intramembrane glutamic endopeptidase [unclassified Cryobacterium]
MSDQRAALTFSVLVLGASLVTANIAEGLVLAISPLLTVLVMMLVATRDGYSRAGWARLGMNHLGLRSWVRAVGASAGISVLAMVAVVTSGIANWRAPSDDWIQSVLVLCITGPILAFAEEIGWRGYLQPRLAFMGRRVSMLIVGLVWVAWHLPYILLTPYYHSAGNQALVLPLFGASVLAFAFLFGELRARSNSLWPSVLAHFAHNVTFAVIGTYFITTDQPVVVNEYLAGDTGLFVFIGTATCVIAMWTWSVGREQRSTVL